MTERPCRAGGATCELRRTNLNPETSSGSVSTDEHPLGEPYLVYRTPDHDMIYTAYVTTDQAKQDKSGTSGTYWWWNGDRDKPTLTPSIGVPAVPPYKWHGFLENGIWRSCE